ncbi:MAG: hypothetical protein IJS26_04715 [Alphaproteobacteria bacterium]|nr:hypothetical protein [Alphaproteobacteria bacterium]
MWKIIKEIAGVLVTIVIIINVVKYYWEFYNPTCTNKDTTTNIVEVLNSIDLIRELGLKVTVLNEIRETSYNRSKKELSCTANAHLSNGEITPISFKVTSKKDSLYYEAEFTGAEELVDDYNDEEDYDDEE